MVTAASQLWLYFRSINPTHSGANDYKNFGAFDNNTYLSFATTTILFKIDQIITGVFTTIILDFATWQTNTAKDANSAATFYPAPYVLPGVFSRLYPFSIYNTIV